MSFRRTLMVVDGDFTSQIRCHVGDKDKNPFCSTSYLLSNPEAVVQTHLDFLKAGANIITTNTFSASIEGIMKHLGLSYESSYELIKSAVELARKAVNIYKGDTASPSTVDNEWPLIAGSVGPYDCSDYIGTYVDHLTEQEIKDWHRPRIQALVEAGVDLLAMETIPSQKEGEVLVELLKEFPQTKAWLSFSCKEKEFNISHGEEFQEAAQTCWEMNPSQLLAVGMNCSNPEFVSSLIYSLNMKRRNNNYFPLVMYPNSGEKCDPPKGWMDGDRCKSLESYVCLWLDLGVTYIGGCCQTNSKTITKVRAAVKKWARSTHPSAKVYGPVSPNISRRIPVRMPNW